MLRLKSFSLAGDELRRVVAVHRAHVFFDLRDAQYFFDGRLAGLDLVPAVGAERAHSRRMALAAMVEAGARLKIIGRMDSLRMSNS